MSMDLRPKLAQEFATAIFDTVGDLDMRDMDRKATIENWVSVIMERFVSHSIPAEHIGSRDPKVIDAFLNKYPKLRPVLEHAKTVAQELVENPVFRYMVFSDPECCHVCTEGQDIHLDIHYKGKTKTVEDPQRPEASENIDWSAHDTIQDVFDDKVLHDEKSPHNQLPEGQRGLLVISLRPYLPEDK